MINFDHNEGPDFSLSRFERMLKTNNVLFFDSDEFERIIVHYLESGKIALAQKASNIALSQHPDSSELKLLKVEILLFHNKLTQADNILDELNLIEPSNPEIYIQKANILSKQNLHHEAIELLQNAADNMQDDEEIFALMAMEYMFLEDYEAAKYYFIKCLEVDEDDSAALYNIIYCFETLEQPEEAIHFLNTFLDRHPYSDIAWHQIGLQYKEIGDYKKALTSFDFAIISDDEFVGAYMEKAKVLEKLKFYSDAIAYYKTTLELEDPSAFAYLRIGKCYEQLDNKEMTLKFFNKALQEDPLLDKAWMAVTDYYCNQNQYRQALYYVRKALAIDEENVSYWERYAKINNNLKQLKEAADGLGKSIEYGNYEFETWITRCDLLIGMNQFDTALEVMEEACQFYPDTAEIEYRLTGLYFNLDNIKSGLIHLEKALKIDSEYAVIMEELFPSIFENDKVQRLLEQNGFL